jgi:predicted glycoside hydrolase/deacetylase ChbG (UPF0249 family)
MPLIETKPSQTEGYFFTADDFGRDNATNRAILHTYREGALHGASLMMGQAGTTEAVAMARDNPGLLIGLHWHFNDSQPLTVAAWPWGATPLAAGWAMGWQKSARELAIREAEAQCEGFVATGLKAAFVNSHHHLQIHPCLWPRLWPLAEKMSNGWLRLGRLRFFHETMRGKAMNAAAVMLGNRARAAWTGQKSDGLWGLDRSFRMQPEEVRRAIARGLTGRQEFLFHPRDPEDQDTRCLVALRDLGGAS